MDKRRFYSSFRVLRFGPDVVIAPAFYTKLYLHFALASRTNEPRLGNFQISEIGENLIENTSTVSPLMVNDLINNCSSTYNDRNK